MQRALWLHTGVSPWNSVVVVLLSADVTAYEVLPEVTIGHSDTTCKWVDIDATMTSLLFPMATIQIPHPSMVRTT